MSATLALVISLASKHIGNTTPLNERNPGIGIEASVTGEGYIAAGRYLNSYEKLSSYVSYGHTFGQTPLGLEVGVATGYANTFQGAREYQPMGALTARVAWAKVLFIPGPISVFGLQVVIPTK